MQNYGIVPQEAMPEPGTLYGDTLPNHNEVDLVATAFVDALATSKLKKLSPVWKQAFSGIYDAYLGKCPEKFTYKGKEYTPQSYMQSLGLNMDDYAALFSTVESGVETILQRVASELLPQEQQAIRLLDRISAAVRSGTEAAEQMNAKK